MNDESTAFSSPALPPCMNCGAPMQGPYCSACGQPEKGMVRPLANVMSDVADTIFNVDSRIFRSILPLYFRPGFLTQEYFDGRRTRYVTPFRLYFFLCVLSIFAIQFTLNLDDAKFDLLKLAAHRGAIEDAQTEAEVDRSLKEAIARVEQARATAGLEPGDVAELDQVVTDLNRQAERRRAWIGRKQAAEARGEAPPPDPDAADDAISFNGAPWDPDANPIAVAWLPAFANAKLNELARRAKGNLLTARNDPRHLVAGIFSALPPTLFVLMPLFAVLLKIVYLFKRRLYMEHLIVALHSHAFIFLSLLLLALLSLLGGLGANASLHAALKLAVAAVWIWLPVYLFLMQKRIYRQGWILTTLKYGVIGIAYIVLLAFVMTAALLVSLTLD